LERREVIDLLPVRSAGATADWLKQHPKIEMISRDRWVRFLRVLHKGAPQARQVADRFHILQNLREAVQAQLSRAAGSSARPLLPADVDDERAAVISSSPRDKHGGAEHRCLTRMANQRSRQALFDRVRALHREGRSISDIVRQTRFDRRTIAKSAAPRTSSPRYFEEYLARRWAEGCVRGRRLLQEVKASGYTGSFSNLERLPRKWRNPKRRVVRPVPPAPGAPSVDLATGRLISPIVAACCVSNGADHYQAPRRRKLTCSNANVRTSPPCDSSPCGFAAFCEARMLASLASG
jgi:hypothetical protein